MSTSVRSNVPRAETWGRVGELCEGAVIKASDIGAFGPTFTLRARFPVTFHTAACLDPVTARGHIQSMNDSTSTNKLRRICVYCGSSPGNDPAYVKAAREFGETLAREHIGLVYGGGNVGIMGEIAHAVLAEGGKVTGIIPEFLVAREHAKGNVDHLIVTKDMHERKRKMFELADAFVALPGGIGTLEELVEQLTWAQLGRHKKPILVANIKGFWEPFCALIDHMKRVKFIRDDLSFDLLIADRVSNILPMIRNAMAPIDERDKEMKEAQPHNL
jgi:uncharacterized protein (TIGR00730 family)